MSHTYTYSNLLPGLGATAWAAQSFNLMRRWSSTSKWSLATIVGCRARRRVAHRWGCPAKHLQRDGPWPAARRPDSWCAASNTGGTLPTQMLLRTVWPVRVEHLGVWRRNLGWCSLCHAATKDIQRVQCAGNAPFPCHWTGGTPGLKKNAKQRLTPERAQTSEE